MIKFIKSVLSFILLTIMGAVIGYGLHYYFDIIYPIGLEIDSWWIVMALLFFSAIIFFILFMFVDLVELIAAPLRYMGGNYRVLGFAAIIIYALFCAWSLYDLRVVFYKFKFTGMDSVITISFAMSTLMSIITIVTYGICITSAWGPKDLTSRRS